MLLGSFARPSPFVAGVVFGHRKLRLGLRLFIFDSVERNLINFGSNAKTTESKHDRRRVFQALSRGDDVLTYGSVGGTSVSGMTKHQRTKWFRDMLVFVEANPVLTTSQPIERANDEPMADWIIGFKSMSREAMVFQPRPAISPSRQTDRLS